MSELNIHLTQIEKNDIASIKTILEAGFDQLLADSFKTFGNTEDLLEKQIDKNSYSFAIRARKEDGHRNFLVGMCGIWEIDWIARHGKMFFIMVDRDGHKATMQNHTATQTAVAKLLSFAFDELNLNKVWIDVLEKNDIKEALEHFGFVAEGIRRASTFRNGIFLNTIICSLTYEEYCDKVSR